MGYGKWDWGVKESRVHIKPVLRGPLPPRPSPLRIISAKGRDLHPVNLSKIDETLSLQAFVLRYGMAPPIPQRCNENSLQASATVMREDAGAWVKALLLDQP